MSTSPPSPPPPVPSGPSDGTWASPTPPPGSAPLPSPAPEGTADGLRPVRWGMGDAAVGFLVANTFAVLVGGVVLAALGFYDEVTVDLTDGVTVKEVVPTISLALTAILQVPLWTGYLGAPILAARLKGNGVVRDFGLRMRWYDLPMGAAAGLATQLLVVPLIYLPLSDVIDLDALSEPARELTGKADDPLGVLLLVLIVVVGAPIVEELFFRGLLMRSIENRFGVVVGVIASSFLFGAIHLQPLQLPALAAFGLVAALLTVKTGRLGPAIWAHVAFNGIATAVLVIGG